MAIRQTHTYSILEVSAAAYAEIRAKLEEAGYAHAFHDERDGEVVDMHGIALCEQVNASCTGLGASWCPVHGDCTCPEPSMERDHPTCPLHGVTRRSPMTNIIWGS